MPQPKFAEERLHEGITRGDLEFAAKFTQKMKRCRPDEMTPFTATEAGADEMGADQEDHDNEGNGDYNEDGR